ALGSGARGGIGRAAAIALAKAGADLVILGRDAGGLSDVCKEVASHGVSVRSVGVDLEDIAGVRRTALQIADTEVIDIVVNNAGSIHRAPLSTQTTDSWRAIMKVNVDAVFEITLPLAKAMIERGFGKIVNVASLLSFQGGINVAGYTASKHALVGLTKAMANEWSSLGVNVNAVAPGYIETANTAALRADPLRNADITARIPAGRWGVPDDIAGAIVFLCSHAARYVHGHVLVVDGGWMGR
ncbi:MAG: SDR family oxidoreductase, partial [Gallionella sp.]|nr:SDR family oxidoreductase [Gallionella sp.]